MERHPRVCRGQRRTAASRQPGADRQGPGTGRSRRASRSRRCWWATASAPLREELRHYGVSEIAVYDDPALGYFRADAYASCVEDYIKHAKPSVVLVGATSLGRSLAPRLSTRFHTGLTADCTTAGAAGKHRPGSDSPGLWRQHHGADRHRQHPARSLPPCAIR